MGDTMPLPLPGLDDTRATVSPARRGDARRDDLLEILARIGVEPRQSLLVAGVDDGELALCAAQLVGPRGRVVALEARASSATGAAQADAQRRRAAELGLGQLELRAGGIESLDAGERFDAVLVVRSALSPVGGGSELARCASHARPRGAVALIDLAAVAGEPAPPADGEPVSESGAAFAPVPSGGAGAPGAGAPAREIDADLPWCFGRAQLPAPRLLLGAPAAAPARAVAAWCRV